MAKDLTKYPSTPQFRIKDTIGVPHPFCIDAKHVCHASDKFMGRLSGDAIRDYEQKHGNRPSCGVKGCDLMYDQHEQALLVAVKDDRPLKEIPELHPYLLSIKDRCEKDGFAGFAFMKDTKEIA